MTFVRYFNPTFLNEKYYSLIKTTLTFFSRSNLEYVTISSECGLVMNMRQAINKAKITSFFAITWRHKV